MAADTVPSALVPPGADTRARLRTQMRARRRALPPREQARAAQALARVFVRSRLLRPGRRIAVYLRQGSEADPGRIIELARERGCALYLPAITSYRQARMRFLRFDATTPLRVNRHGILEPEWAPGAAISVRRLDLILLPLVAADAHGWRLGSGAGYYDRCLQHLRAGRLWRRPRLIGVGYDFQRVPQLEAAPWDVPLDGLLTDRALYPARRGVPPEPLSVHE